MDKRCNNLPFDLPARPYYNFKLEFVIYGIKWPVLIDV